MKGIYALILVLYSLMLAGSGCAGEDRPVIIPMPDLRQMTDYSCGSSALQSVLFYYGFDVREMDLAGKLGTDNSWGTEHTKIEKIAREYGLKVEMRRMTKEEVKGYINRKIPVILIFQAWSEKKNPDYTKTKEDGHYAVAIGYDAKGFIFEDPSTVGRGHVPYDELEIRWHDWDKRGTRLEHFGIVIYGPPPAFEPGKIEHID